MTDEEKFQKVREWIAERCANAYFGLWERLEDKDKDNWRKWVEDQILSLKDENGKPMLGVISDNQELPKSPLEEIQGGSPQYEPEYYIGYEIAQQDMLEQNRPRVIKKEG